jgi:hypothetical protein
MGFHVNVSAVDENGKIVKLTKGMFAELIYDWLPYEKKNYRTFRGEGSDYAQKIQDYINDDNFIKIVYENVVNKNNEKLKVSEIYEPYGVALWYINRLINKEKMLSMTHHKQNNVIEFRLFNSSTDIEKLISYTQDAITVFRGAIQKYCSNPIETLIQIQKNNLRYKYLTLEIPIKNFKGSYYDFMEYLSFRKDSKPTKIAFYIKRGFFGFGKPKREYKFAKQLVKLQSIKEIEYFYIVIQHYEKYFVYIIYNKQRLILDSFEIPRKEFLIMKDEFEKSQN